MKRIGVCVLGHAGSVVCCILLLACSCGNDPAHDMAAVDLVGEAVGPKEEVRGDLLLDSRDDLPVPPQLSRLRAQGKLIVNQAGETVVLKGVNLGGWLFHETWITQVDYPMTSRLSVLAYQQGIGQEVDALLATGSPSWGSLEALMALEPDLATVLGAEKAATFVESAKKYFPGVYSDADLPLRRKLVDRFGAEGRDELFDVFEDAWIREKDIQWIAQQGFNVVRVPITYRNLVLDSDKEKPESLEWNEATFERLHTLLGWCETHGLYAVIDIQESPGGHNGYAGASLLYQDVEMQEYTVLLWEEIASRLGKYDGVAAYSLLAEPMGAPDAAARDAMYDKLVTAIRALGDDHLIIIHDGFLGMDTLPEPSEYGWTNVLYSTHLFEFSADSFQYWKTIIDFYHDPVFRDAQKRHNVPYYMGSFSARTDAEWAYEVVGMLLEWFHTNGWSWSIWTYKRIDDPIERRIWNRGSSYGLLGRLEGEFQRPDVFSDDFETLKAKFAAYAQLEISPNEQLMAVIFNSKSMQTTGHQNEE